MRLIDMEEEIKNAIFKYGNKSEIVYQKIYNLSESYLWRRHCITNTNNIPDIATIMAEDLFMIIYSGREIGSWIGYMSRYYLAAIRIWNNMNSSQIIDTSSDMCLL